MQFSRLVEEGSFVLYQMEYEVLLNVGKFM